MSHTYHKNHEGFYRVRDEQGRMVCRDISVEKTAKIHAAAQRMLDWIERAIGVLAEGKVVKAAGPYGGDYLRHEARALLREINGKEPA